MNPTTVVPAVIGLVSALATLLQIFGIVLPTTEIGIVITSLFSVYGAIHQIVVVKSANTAAVTAGFIKQ